ncbi:MAG: hypothetical protein RJB13_854 [Pseudomonadota bacterium]
MNFLSAIGLFVLGVSTGCGQSDFSLSQSQSGKPPARVNQDPESGVEQSRDSVNHSNADASPVQQQPMKVSPPIPVIGSYLVGELLNEELMPVKDAEVTVEEAGVEPLMVKTDANGRYRIGIVSLGNVTSISVKGVSFQATLPASAVLKSTLEQAVEDKSGNIQKLLQLRLSTLRGVSQLSYQLVVAPEQDKLSPQMTVQVSEVAGGIQVAVTAKDYESGLAELAYSFDKGVSWSRESIRTLPAGTTILPGTIVVRDRAGNRASNSITISAN